MSEEAEKKFTDVATGKTGKRVLHSRGVLGQIAALGAALSGGADKRNILAPPSIDLSRLNALKLTARTGADFSKSSDAPVRKRGNEERRRQSRRAMAKASRKRNRR